MSTNIEGREYLSVSEVANMAGVAPVTIRRYAKAGKIRFIQPGGHNARLLFPLDCLEQSGTLTGDSTQVTSAPRSASKRLSGRRPKWQDDRTK